MPGIQVSIVDPHQLSREGLRLILAEETYDVVSAATSLEAALTDIEGGVRPGLLILTLDTTSQSATLQQIRTIVPECKVVLIANGSLPGRLSDWGLNGLLRSDVSKEVLVRSLHLVMLGQDIFPASSSVQPQNPDENGVDAVGSAGFHAVRRISDREGRVLHYLLSGCSNKMIARELAIAEATVKVHMKAVLRKLNVRNRTQAAMWAAANGFSEKSGSGFPLPPAHSRPIGNTEGPGVKLVA